MVIRIGCLVLLVALAGCGEGAAERVVVNAPPPPEWVPSAVLACAGKADAEAARARLFTSGTDREAFAGLVAFADAKNVEMRRIAAFHLASMAPVADLLGVPAGDALKNLAKDGDEKVRRLASHVGNSRLEGVEVTPIDSGEATVGVECAIPYPGREGIWIHLFVRGITPAADGAVAHIDYKAEARLKAGSVLGSSGRRHGPNLTGLSYLGILTDDAQLGFDLWLRVIGKEEVRWWLRGLSRPVTEERDG